MLFLSGKDRHRSILALWLVPAAIVVVSGSAPRQLATGFVLGRVLDAVTGQPISGAQVTLAKLADASTASSPSAQPNPSLPKAVVVTNSDGSLLFRELTSGRYSLTVTAIGYLPGGYLQRSPADTRVHLLELKEGERRTDADVRLWKLGSIAGAVMDEAGHPASGANVSILRRAYAAGRVSLMTAATATTDDRGLYAAGGLLPADYIVGIRASQLTIPVALSERYAAARAAAPDPTRAPPLALELMNSGVSSPAATGYQIGDWIRQISDNRPIGYPPPPPRSDGRVLSYRSAYFVGTDNLLEATKITLRASEDRRGVDLTLRLTEAVRVSGRLLGPDGPVQDLGVRLLSPGSEAYLNDRGLEAARTVSDTNGAFTFLGVLPGTYRLVADRVPIAVPPGQPAAPIIWAEQSLAVDRDDVSDLTITLRPGLTMSGRFEFTGGKTPPQNMPPIAVGLRAVGAGVIERSTMSFVPPVGTFTTKGNVAGRYFVEAWPPAGWQVRSITYAGKNVADEPFDLSADVSDVVVTFTDVLSRLSGTVTKENGSPDSEANVIYFPAESDGWRRGDFNAIRSRRLTAKIDGTFLFLNIPAGAYYMVAVDDAVAAEYANPAMLEKLVRGATRVTIAEGENKIVALKTLVVK